MVVVEEEEEKGAGGRENCSVSIYLMAIV